MKRAALWILQQVLQGLGLGLGLCLALPVAELVRAVFA